MRHNRVGKSLDKAAFSSRKLRELDYNSPQHPPSKMFEVPELFRLGRALLTVLETLPSLPPGSPHGAHFPVLAPLRAVDVSRFHKASTVAKALQASAAVVPRLSVVG